ncbi:MAG: TonB-dependent receptor [Steroidobacteraceae bacterium]
MKKVHRRMGDSGLSIAATSLLTVLCHSAWAQNAGDATAAPGQGESTLAEIVITADKVSENLEQAPLAVTAITGGQLTALGVTSVTDLSSIIPNFTAAPNSEGSTIAIRGIVSTAQTLTGDSEVSYSLDGVNMINKIAAFQGMYDVDRVEVLRGPQGTNYGANANAGAINVITNNPDLTRSSASGSLGFGNYNSLDAGAVFNMPLTDTLAIRIAADHQYHDGYVHLLTNTSDFDDEDMTQGRVKLLWKPWENFTALLAFEEAHDGGAGDGGAGSGAPLGLYVSQQGISPYSYAAMPGQQSLDEQIRSTTLTLDWSTPFVDMNFVGNIRTLKWYQSDPETIYGPDATYCQNTVDPSQCFNPLISHSYDRQGSQELRFSKSEGSLHWLFGLYHIKDVYSFNIQFEPAPFDPAEWAEIYSNYYEEDKAAYGQLSWDFTDKFTVIGAIRYQNDVKNLPSGGFASAPIGSFTGNLCTNCSQFANFDGYGSWDKITWHVGLNYKVTPDSFLFASVATGYESGGFSTGATEPLNPAYGPENVTNYEIGWKNKFLDGRAQTNLDAFYMNYTGYQVTTSILAPNGAYETATLNSGKARIKGVELESTFLATPIDKITFNATALSAVFTDFYLPLGDGYVTAANGIGPTNYTGNQLPYAPHWTGRLGYEHTFELGGADSLIAHLDSGYSSHYYLDYHNYAAVAQGGYSRSGAFINWQHRRDDKVFNTQIYVRNIEDKAILAGGQGDSSAPGHDFNDYGKNGYYLPPRTFGVLFTASF